MQWLDSVNRNKGRVLLQGENCEEALNDLLTNTLLLIVLPGFHHAGEPAADLTALAHQLSRPLVAGVLEKLARRFREKDRARLIRYHPDQALALINQGAILVSERLSADLEAWPEDKLSTRVARLAADLARRRPILPSRRGRSAWVGGDYALWLLVAYEGALKRLTAALPRWAWKRAEQPVRAAAARTAALAILSDGMSRPLPSDAIAAAAACDSRERAALTLVSVLTPAKLSPDHLRDLLRRTRPWALRLDAADRAGRR